MSILQAVRGTRDLLPPETELWNHIESTARQVFERYCFGEIRTPIFEDTQLFSRGVGEETDIVSKEMYTFTPEARIQGESAQSLTLRPENTAGVVRAYIEHQMGETGQLQKLYYIGPQFRRERPQRGRYRQFFQIGAEVIGPPSAGSESPLRDAEVLEMLATLLSALGITGWRLLLNSVGSATDRPRYVQALRAALEPVVSRMCEDCQRRAVTNPLRVLDCKHPEDQPIIATLPRIWESLDEGSKEHFAAVCTALDACGVPYEHDHRLVRGLDYYTRTTFEFVYDEPGEGGLGSQNALLGGGRYDGLSEAIGGPKAPGIGFAIGEDRLVLVLEAQGKAFTAAGSGVHCSAGRSHESPCAGASQGTSRHRLAGGTGRRIVSAQEIVRGRKQSGAGHRDSRRGRGCLRYLDGKALRFRRAVQGSPSPTRREAGLASRLSNFKLGHPHCSTF